MNELFLLKLGEIILKGANRRVFEDRLRGNIVRRMQHYGDFKVYITQSTVYVEPQSDDCDMDGAWEACGTVFGVISMCRCRGCEKDLDAIYRTALDYLGDDLAAAKSFKVESRRADKRFPLTSIQISQEIGGRLAEQFPALRVDVHAPDYTVYVGVRDHAAYVHGPALPGAGGLPTGCGGRAAVLLSGGSAFGLDAAGGVQRYLEERDIGFDVGVTKVPLVSQSCLFDLGVGSKEVRPTAEMAYQACENAGRSAPAEGNVGAGTGCSIGKYRGMDRAMKSGFGTYALQTGPLKVGALVAVNALGDVYGPDGRPAAGLLNEKRTSLSCTLEEMFADIAPAENLFAGNTTLGVVVTNGKFDKTPLTKIAGMAHNGYARAIRPVHTTADGDSIYALSLGDVPGDINVVGAMAALTMERAILRAVQSAGSAYGLIGWEDLPR